MSTPRPSFTAKALPRWKRMKKLRDNGKTYAQIGAAFGVGLCAVFKCLTKLESIKYK